MESGEKVVFFNRIKIYSNIFFSRPGYFWLTNKRIVIVMHYLFGPDEVLSFGLDDIERFKIKKASMGDGSLSFERFILLELISFGRVNFAFYCFAGQGKYIYPSNKKTKKLYQELANVFKKENRSFNFDFQDWKNEEEFLAEESISGEISVSILVAITSVFFIVMEFMTSFSVGGFINQIFPCEQNLQNPAPCFFVYDKIFTMLLVFILIFSN